MIQAYDEQKNQKQMMTSTALTIAPEWLSSFFRVIPTSHWQVCRVEDLVAFAS